MKKKAFALLLALCVALAALPLSAGAEGALKNGCELYSVTVNGVTAHPNEYQDFYITLPYGTDLSALRLSFSVSEGASVYNYSNNELITSSDAFDYTENSYYRFSVLSEDGANMNYYDVYIGVSAPQICSATINGVTAYPDSYPDGDRIRFYFPEGTDISALKISFEGDSAPITVRNNETLEFEPYDSSQAYDFSFGELLFRMEDEKAGEGRIMNVQVYARDPYTDCELYSLSLDGIKGYPDENNVISIKMPMGTDLTDMAPAWYYSLSWNAHLQYGWYTDFSSPHTITVEAEDGFHTQAYTLIVSTWDHEPNHEARIYSATINGATSQPNSGNDINFYLPELSDASALNIEFESSEGAKVLIETCVYNDGVYANYEYMPFDENKQYNISGGELYIAAVSEDGLICEDYRIRLLDHEPTAECELYSLTINGVTGRPDENNTISIKLPVGTDLTDLDVSYSYSISSYARLNGVYVYDSSDFSQPRTITVTAEDGVHKKEYTLVLSVWDHEPNHEAKIYSATINGVTEYPTYHGDFRFTLPAGTDITALRIEYDFSPNATIYKGWRSTAEPYSPTAEYDFTYSPYFTIISEDDQTEKSYEVTVEIEGASGESDYSAEITEVSVSNYSVTQARIDDTTFSLHLPYGLEQTALQNLKVSFSVSSWSAYIINNGQYVQRGDVFDLTSPQQFTVISGDRKESKTYTVQASVFSSPNQCGDDAYYKLEDGVLTVYGTGPMDDFNWNFGTSYGWAPWYSDEDGIVSVVVSQGITSIGSGAFYYDYAKPENYGNLTSVTLAASVKEIRERAFYQCSNLSQITLNSGLETIGAGAFVGCDSLQNVTIPDTVTVLGDSTFCDCDNLRTVSLGKGLTEIGNNAFSYCDSLSSIALPHGLKSIGNHAFSYCPSLKEITLPNSLQTLGGYAFYGSGVKSLHLPASVTELDVYSSWYNSLAGIDTFTVDANNATYAAENNVLFNKEKTHLLYYSTANTNTAYQVPSSVTAIAYSAFQNCASLQELTLPASLTSIGNSEYNWDENMDYPQNVFSGCTDLQAIHVAAGNTVYSDQDGVLFSADAASLKFYPVSKPGNTYTIPATVSEISEQAFNKIISLSYFDVAPGNTHFEFRDDVLYGEDITYRVADSSVHFNKVLYFCRPQKTKLVVEEGVDSCYRGAFNRYTDKGEVTYDERGWIPHFDNQTGYYLEYIVFPDDVTNNPTANGRFGWNFTGINTLSISDKKPTIYGTKGTFAEEFAKHHHNLLFVEGQPDDSKPKGSCGDDLVYETDLETGTVTITGTGAMDNFSSAAPWSDQEITSLEIASGATSIGSNAFAGCESLTDVTIPASVTKIADSAFEGCGEDLVIHGEGNTAAETVAMTQDISFDAADVAAVADDPMLEVDRIVAVHGRIAIAAEINNDLENAVSGSVVAAIYYQGKMVSTATLSGATEVEQNTKARKVLQLKYKDSDLDDKEISVKLFYLKEDSLAPWDTAATATKTAE